MVAKVKMTVVCPENVPICLNYVYTVWFFKQNKEGSILCLFVYILYQLSDGIMVLYE